MRRAGSGSEVHSAVALEPSAALSLTKLTLTNFRSYEDAAIAVEAAPVVLAGANGTGKTNLLEAISLLSPGRGLRGAKLSEIQRKAPEQVGDALWAVAATLSRPDGQWEIGTGLAPTAPEAREKRLIHLNGAAADSADIAELLPMLWLTPVMDRLFLEGASGRRKFLDRLVFGLHSGHARIVARYERAMRERLRVLTEGPRDAAWLDGLEETMTETGVAVTTARNEAIDKLNGELSARGVAGAFPCAYLALEDGCAGIGANPTKLQAAFAASRGRDAEVGRTSTGPHLADLLVRHTAKRTDARDCSTGEQKALLISIVLANAWLQKRKTDDIAPILLLDEIAAHLDIKRRAALFEEILSLSAQAWMTGTDMSLFEPLGTRASRFSVVSGQFVRADKP